MKTLRYLWALTRVSGNGKGDPAPLMRCCHPRHEMAPPRSALSYTTGWGFLYGRVPKRCGKALQGMARLHRHWNGFTGTGTALQALARLYRHRSKSETNRSTQRPRSNGKRKASFPAFSMESRALSMPYVNLNREKWRSRPAEESTTARRRRAQSASLGSNPSRQWCRQQW